MRLGAGAKRGSAGKRAAAVTIQPGMRVVIEKGMSRGWTSRRRRRTRDNERSREGEWGRDSEAGKIGREKRSSVGLRISAI